MLDLPAEDLSKCGKDNRSLFISDWSYLSFFYREQRGNYSTRGKNECTSAEKGEEFDPESIHHRARIAVGDFDDSWRRLKRKERFGKAVHGLVALKKRGGRGGRRKALGGAIVGNIVGV